MKIMWKTLHTLTAMRKTMSGMENITSKIQLPTMSADPRGNPAVHLPLGQRRGKRRRQEDTVEPTARLQPAETRGRKAERNTKETGPHLAQGGRGDTDLGAPKTNTKTRTNRRRGVQWSLPAGVLSTEAAAVVPAADPSPPPPASPNHPPDQMQSAGTIGTNRKEVTPATAHRRPSALTSQSRGRMATTASVSATAKIREPITRRGIKGTILRSLAPSPSSAQTHVSPHLRCAKHHADHPKSPGGPAAQMGEDGSADDSKPLSESLRRRGGRPRVREKTSHSPAHSSDTEPHTKTKNQKKRKACHSSKRHHRGRGQNRHRSSSVSPGRHKHTSKKKKGKSHGTARQRSSSWSSGGSSSRAHSREHGSSKNKSPHARQNNSRERDSPHHSDAERARRRSRSYSPIRKRRRDSPSFMEARRITSARKRPIPYYRPSPSSSSSGSGYSSSSRNRSRSFYSCSSYSRSRSRSRSRSPSPAHSYYSQSSYDSPGF
ncbi:serine/arginine repetitive matrix protein 3-like isoform X1 [Cyprinus carpio]|uniref:Serine/arginine repetitive matrix protein 3-like isoform X1 n=1 Tax=Cyprinus carpio TaxID=7962 RepID=A0A9Q9Y578_CYPCA|nr:serine/arginine repetitive matrix protein 3-like isoform X1 [Cyprinus carpio]